MRSRASSFYQKMNVLNIRPNNFKSREAELFRIRINENLFISAGAFCDDRFGDNWIWSMPVNTDYMDMFFLHEADALQFKLTFESYHG